MNKALYGIVPALITPLNQDRTLDVASLERLIEHLLAGGAHGIFAAGMTGEGAALPPDMLRQLIRECARIIHGRVPLCAGVLESSARRTIETALQLADAGADILSTTVPYAPPVPEQEEILAHFDLICRRVDMPWMVYGNAGCMTSIQPDTMGQLARLPGICAIKDTRPDFEGHLKNIMAVRGGHATLLSGGEYLVGPGMLFGADGNISGATNLFPRLFRSLYDAAEQGDVATVAACSERIARIHAMTALPGACWLAVFKYAGSCMGLMQPWCCRPAQPLTPRQASAVRRMLAELDESIPD